MNPIESIQLDEYTKKESFIKEGYDGLMTMTQMAQRWEISARRVALLCSQGRLLSAEKIGNAWLIPEEAEEPKDPRKQRNARRR